MIDEAWEGLADEGSLLQGPREGRAAAEGGGRRGAAAVAATAADEDRLHADVDLLGLSPAAEAQVVQLRVDLLAARTIGRLLEGGDGLLLVRARDSRRDVVGNLDHEKNADRQHQGLHDRSLEIPLQPPVPLEGVKQAACRVDSSPFMGMQDTEGLPLP